MTTLQTALTVATTATASAALAAGKHTPVDATSGTLTMTLPTPARAGARLRVERVDTSANAVTVTGTIRGTTASLLLLGQYDQLEFVAETTSSWRIAAGHRPKAITDAVYAASTVGNRLRRAANSSPRKDGLAAVMATPPTVTVNGGSNPDATLTNSYRTSVAGQAAAFRITGGTSALYASVYTVVSDVSTPSGTGGSTSGNGARVTYAWAVEFYTDAPKLALRMLATTYIGLEVNDQPVSASAITVGGGGTQYVTVDFTSAGGAATRKIRVEFAQASGFDGVYVGATYTVWPPVSETNLRVVSVGDSVCASTGATQAGTPWQISAGKILGWTDVRQVAFGGSGFTVNGSGNTFGSALRVSDVVAHNPDLLVISATGNDNNQAGIQAAALATFQAYRAALPKVPIIVTGVDTNRGTTALTTQQATETTVKAAFDQWADPNSWWIPITNDPAGPWLTGSGGTGSRTVADAVLNSTTTITSATAAFSSNDVGVYVTGTGIPANAKIASVTNSTTAVLSAAATASASGVTVVITAQTGDGNADRLSPDRTHLTDAGHQFFGARYAVAFRTTALPLIP